MGKHNSTAASPDAVIEKLAARQHGVVTRAQLLRSGISADVVDGRLARGQLHPLHRGVFQVGPIAATRFREMAAHLACGADSFVSYRSAVGLWQQRTQDSEQPVEILVRGRERWRPGIVVRRAGNLRNDEVTKLDGIPITTPARTITDLAAVLTERELEQVVAQSLSRRLTTRAQDKARCLGPTDVAEVPGCAPFSRAMQRSRDRKPKRGF